MRPRSVGVTVAIVAALVSVMALLALRPSLLPARGRSAQVYIFGDDQHSESATLLLNVVEALPLFQGHDDQRMTCDGVAFSYGAPPWQSLLGYYGNVHTRPTGQSYHCVLRDWPSQRHHMRDSSRRLRMRSSRGMSRSRLRWPLLPAPPAMGLRL
jgi:hypothetical protein